MATAEEEEEEATEELDGLPFVQLSSDILQTELSLLKADARPSGGDTPLGITAVENKQRRRGWSPLGRNRNGCLPGCHERVVCIAGNVTEQLWNFTWPAAIATLNPSLLPVAVLGFFSKVRHACSALPSTLCLCRLLVLGGPTGDPNPARAQFVVFLVGDLVSSLPRIPAYRSLTAIQTAAHLVSAAMVTYATPSPSLELRLPRRCSCSRGSPSTASPASPSASSQSATSSSS